MDNKDKEHVNNDHAPPEEEEEDEEAKRAVVLGPQVPLKEQLELDKVGANQSSNRDF